MSERRPSLQSVIDDAMRDALRDLPTLIPAKVVKWDASTGKANVQILIKNVDDDETGERVATSWPVVTGVPVQFVGAGGFRITCPISDGSSGDATTGSLIFAMRSLDKWLAGDGMEVDPEFDHDHALADAVFFPGLMPFGNPWASMSTTKASIGSDSDANGRIEFTSSTIELGAGATKEVARKGDAIHAGTVTASANLGTGVVTFVYTSADGVPMGGGTTLVLDSGKITGGSAHVKAVD